MGNGSGVSRGDRNRNGRLERLRALHAVITTGQAWDPATATHGTRHDQAKLAA